MKCPSPNCVDGHHYPMDTNGVLVTDLPSKALCATCRGTGQIDEATYAKGAHFQELCQFCGDSFPPGFPHSCMPMEAERWKNLCFAAQAMALERGQKILELQEELMALRHGHAPCRAPEEMGIDPGT